MSNSDIKYASGRTKLAGQSIIYADPISLAPDEYEGAIVYSSDREMYFSDGEDWVVISGAPIRRPFALEPITPQHFRQLRLSSFQAASGQPFTQVGVIFRVSLLPNMSSPILFETVTSVSANSYELPAGFLAAGDTFYWDGKYLATDNQESQFSRPFAQVFPPIIDTPIPLNTAGANALVLQVGPYGSAFNYVYGSTSWEIYTSPSGGGSPLLSETNSSTSLNLGPFQSTVLPGATYYWRARFNDDTTLVSAFSEIQPFVMDNSFLLRDTADTQFYVGRTIRNSLNTSYTVPATVLSNDGTSYTCP
jgi:hypothetical protein